MERIPVYPTRYTPDDLAVDAAITFAYRSGETVDITATPLISGACGTWVLRIANQDRDLPAGAAIALIRFNCQLAFELQTRSPQGRDYCTLETASAARLHLSAGRSSINLLTVHVVSGVFAKGETCTLHLGDRRQGSAGCELFWTATSGRFLLAVDADGSGAFRGVRGNPFDFRVVAHPEPRLLRLLGPTVAAPGEPFTLHLSVFDRNRNPIENYAGSVEFEVPEYIEGLPASCAFTPEDSGLKIFPDIRITRPGVYRIPVHGAAGTSTSNPIVVRPGSPTRAYWGDVHAHGWGDSTMYLMHLRSEKLDPIGRHLQARDLGRPDFACPGAMSMAPDKRDETWEPYRQAWRQLDEPGRYVPFLSYEAHPREGDRQVIFKGDAPAPPSMRLPMPELDAFDGERDDVLLETHIGGAPPRWDLYRPERERFLEICSGFGCAEWLLQKALQLGYRPAICAASDLHLGLLGGPRAVETFRGRFGQKYPMNQRDAAYGTGPLTAVCASELTRDALWQAIVARQTYATSGARIFLEFLCDGQRAGAEIRPRDELALSITCHACAPIRRVDLICGAHRLRSWEPATLDFSVEFILDTDQFPGTWLYLRVEQTDGEYAWTSPFFLEHQGEPPLNPSLPAWNDDGEIDLSAIPANDATSYLAAVRTYLQREEHPSRFHELTPAGILDLHVGRCALFFCRWGDERLPMSIRWFFEFEIPKIRYDFGWRDYGAVDELELGPKLMEKYG